jgi:NTP pyrophosphatase (non-canonical NTP hydrolase)
MRDQNTFDRPSRALNWAVEMFGDVALEPRERTMRFVEEAIELAHAMHLERSTLDAIVERVYSRKHGLIYQEIGQSQITLECLAKSIGVDPEAEADREFFRIQAIPKAEWERRHAAKLAIGIATLVASPHRPQERPES